MNKNQTKEKPKTEPAKTDTAKKGSVKVLSTNIEQTGKVLFNMDEELPKEETPVASEKVKDTKTKTKTTPNKETKKKDKPKVLNKQLRRPPFQLRILPNWGKGNLKVDAKLTFTENEKIKATIKNDGRLLLVGGKEIDGVDDSARKAFSLSRKKPKTKTVDGLKFWKTADGKTLRELFDQVEQQ